MTRKVSLSAIVISVATVVTLAAAFVTPAGAHHKDGHEGGKPESAPGQSENADRSEDQDDAARSDKAEGQGGQSESQSSQGRARSGSNGDGSGAGRSGSAGRPDEAGAQGDVGKADGTPGESHPPGNNGTVKIDGEPFDTFPPNNEPHVGCVFHVDFYGYDEGEDLFASITLDLHPPTGGGTIFSTDGKTIFIGEDAAGGGTDLDASVEIDLTEALLNSGVEPHPLQGWHIFLTVHADGSIGADVKHKVFWVKCPPEEEIVGAVEEEEVLGEIIFRPAFGELERPAAPAAEEEVLGARITREAAPEVAGEAQAQPEGEGVLPFTGAGLGGIALAGLALMTAGGALLRIRRS